MKKPFPLSYPLHVTLLYLFVGGAWILLTDWMTQKFVNDPFLYEVIQTSKGWFFILVTASLLFFVLKRERDIRKKAEQGYENIFEHSPQGFFQSTPQGRFKSVNPTMAHIFGYDSPEDMIATIENINIQMHLSGENRKKFIDQLLQDGYVENFEGQNLRKDGSLIWTLTSARIVKDANGNILYYEGFLQDITERKKAELALLESEWEFRGLYENNPLMLFNMDPTGLILAANQTACQLLGYSLEDLIGRQAIRLVHKQDRRNIIQATVQCLQTPNKIFQLEFRSIAKDGRVIWVEGSSRSFLNKHGQVNIFVVGEDIDERKRAELSLIQAEQRYRALVEQLPFVVYREKHGEENQHIYLSPQIEKILGYTLKELEEKPDIWHQAIHPDDLERVMVEHERTDQTLEPYQVEYRAIKKDGTIVWLHDQAIAFKNEEGIPQYWQGILMDVSDQKKAQESLTQSEVSYRGLFNTVTDAIYIQDEQGIFLDVNEGAVNMYGYAREELIGKTPVDVSAPEKNDMQALGRQTQLALQGQAQQFEFWGRRKNGEIFPKNVRLSKGTYFGRDVLIAFAEDITERKKVEDALRAAEARYRSLVEHLPAVVYIDAPESAITYYISPQIESLMGYSPAEWLADDALWNRSIHPEERESVLREEAEIQSRGEPFSREYRMVRRDGKIIWVYDQAILIRGGDGSPLYYQGILLETTKQREAEEAIRQSEERFSKVFEASSIAICITTLEESKFIDANQAYWDLSGLKPADVIGHTAFELDIWEDQEEREQRIGQLRQNKSLRGLEGRFKKVSGELRDTMIFHELIRIGNEDCILSMFHDITDEKKARDELRRKEAILNSIAFAADQFLKSPQWTSNISAILEKLGLAAESSRVYIFKHVQEAASQTIISQLFEWCAPQITPFIDDDSMHSFDMVENGLGRWAEMLVEGQPIFGIVRELPAAEQTEFIREGILSLLCMPIMVGKEWWGFIGLDDCTAERSWSESEIEALHTAANIISAAIQREQAENAVQNQVKELMMLHSVALFNSIASDRDELIHQVTEIISDNFMPDNCGVLLVSEDRKMVLPHPSYRGLVIPGAGNPMGISEGVVGEVVVSGRAVCIGDTQKVQKFVPVSHNIRSELCVPIISDNQVIGAINIESRRIDAYSESDERLINTIAGGLGTAISKFNLFEAERRRAEEAENLRQATVALTNSLDLNTLLETILDLLGKFAEYDSASISLNRNNVLEIVAGRHLPSDFILFGRIFPITEQFQQIFTSRKPMIIEDVLQDPSFERWPGTAYIRGWMGIPLIVQDRIIGMINLDSRKVGTYSDKQSPLLQTFANQAAIAIENARLFESEQQRRHEAETLREAATAVASTLDLDQSIQVILEQLDKVVPFHSASVQLLRDGYLEIVGGMGWTNLSAVKGMRFPVPGDNPNSIVITERRSYLINNAPSNYETFRRPPHNHINSWLGVPLIVRDRIIGMLAIDHSIPNFYTVEHVHMAETFAIQAAIAIENARLFAGELDQRLREASMLDLMRLAASSLDLDEVNQTILGHILKLIVCNSGTIQTLQGDRLRISAAIGFAPETLKRGNTLLLDDFPINQTVVREKRSIRVDDVGCDENYRWIPGVAQIRSFMCVPIIFKEEVIGIVTLDSFTPSRFTKEDEELALAIANNAANAIGNAGLFEMEQHRRQEAENLRLAASAITSTLDAHQVLETILVAIQQVVPYYSATMFLLDGDMVRIAAAQGLHVDVPQGHAFPADNKLFLDMQDTHGQPLILYDAQIDPRFEKWLADDVRGWMGVPLITRGETVGYITLDSDKVGTFNENSAALAQTFAAQAAIAIDNARLYEETRRRLDELEVVSRVSFALRATQDPSRMLPMLMKEVLKVIGTDAASVWLYNSRTYMLDQVTASGWQAEVSIKHMHPSESIVGHVYQTGEVHIIQDFQSDPYAHPSLASSIGRGWGGIAVPIRTTTQTIGAMIVALPQPRKVSSQQVQLLNTLTEIAGSAIHRAQLYDQSEEQVRRLTALRDVDTAISSSFDLRVTLNILLDHTLSQLNVDAASIMLYNPDLHMLNHLANLGFRQSSNIQTSLRITNRLLNETLLERKDMFVEKIAAEPNHHRKELASQENLVSYFATPLISKGQVKGILEVYLRRTFLPEANWVDFFHTMAGQAAIAIDNAQLFENLQRTNQDLSLAYDTTLEGWGKALELRDKETQGHTLRVTDLTMRLARRLGIPESELIHVRRGVLLHDIGKMAVPDHILKKAGRLTEDEWAEMRMHPQYAYDLLYPINYLRPALAIPYGHHEYWNGNGYPRGLKGDEIPLAARIFAVVDVYDALMFDRPYREAWPQEKVFNYLLSEAGTHFDPAIVNEFIQMIQEGEQKLG